MGGAAADGAAEGERAGLRADDLEAGRLGDQARRRRRRRARARRTCRARRPPRRRRPAARPRARSPASRSAASACSAATTAALHVDRAAAVHVGRPRSRPTTGRARHGSLPGADDVDVAVERDRPGRVPGSVTVSPSSSSRGASSPGWSGVGAQRGEVVLVQLGVEPERGGQLAEPLERRALVAGDARHLDQRGGVAGERGARRSRGERRLGAADPLAARVEHRRLAQLVERRAADARCPSAPRAAAARRRRARGSRRRAPSAPRRGRRAARCRARPRRRSCSPAAGARASARCRARRRRRRARDGRSSPPRAARPPARGRREASRPNAAASRAIGTENVRIPQPSVARVSSPGSTRVASASPPSIASCSGWPLSM